MFAMVIAKHCTNKIIAPNLKYDIACAFLQFHDAG